MTDSQERAVRQEAVAAGHRRGFLARLSGWVMGAGLLGGYGALAALAARFLYPARPDPRGWMFAARVADLAPGAALAYETPAGEAVLIARQGVGASADDFVALSSICPHLGCRVRWEGARDRFFCPCHDGAFDRRGVATSGPPAAAGQRLARYALKVEGGLLFIEVSLAPPVLGDGRRPA
jgi:Rieske Fe-S protein